MVRKKSNEKMLVAVTRHKGELTNRKKAPTKSEKPTIDEDEEEDNIESLQKERAADYVYPIIPAIRLMLLDAFNIILIPLQILYAVFEAFTWILSILWPTLVYLLIIWGIFWGIVVFWDFVMIFVVLVGTPLLNITILLFNFFLDLLIVMYIIGSTVWNAIVPFLGMLIKLILDLVLGVLSQVFQLLGSIDLQPFFDAIMEILPPIVEIAVIFLQVIIEVGSDVIGVVVVIIRPLLEIFFEILKTVVQIIIWLVKPLFTILEPILAFIGALFGSGDSGGTSMKFQMGRKLMSAGLSVLLVSSGGVQNEPGAGFLEEGEYGPLTEENSISREDALVLERQRLMLEEYYDPDPGGSWHATQDIVRDIMRNSKKFEERDSYSLINGTLVPKPGSRFQAFASGRKILEKPSSYSEELKAAHRSYGREDEEELTFSKGSSKLDDMAHSVAHHWYGAVKGIQRNSWDDAMDLFTSIREAQKENSGHLSHGAIRTTYKQTIGAKHTIPHEESLASVKYTTAPEHPVDVAIKLHKERQVMAASNSAREFSGRKLMATPGNWEEAKQSHMKSIEIEHARQVLGAQEVYVNHHYDRMKFATAVYNGISGTLKTHAETTFHPDNFKEWYNDALEHFGYEDIWHVRQDFIDTHGDANGYVRHLSSYLDNPILNYLREQNAKDEGSNKKDQRFFSDWNQAESDRVGKLNSGRKLMATVNTYEESSQSAIDSLALMSSLSCYPRGNQPKNPMCLPAWPKGVLANIPTVVVSRETKEAMLTRSHFCTPWYEVKYLVGYKNFYNLIQEFRFFISAIPFFNFPIATITYLAPWTGWFLDWLFLVPKFGHPTAFQIVCFIRHLYDAFVCGVVIWLFSKIVLPVVRVFYRTLKERWNSSRIQRQQMDAEITSSRITFLEMKIEKLQDYYRDHFSSNIGSSIHKRKKHRVVKEKNVTSNTQLFHIINQHFQIPESTDNAHADHYKSVLRKRYPELENNVEIEDMDE